MLTVQFIGSGDAFGSGGRFQPCIALRADGFVLPFFILDAQFRRGTKPLTLAGPPGLRTRLDEALEADFPGSLTVQRKFETSLLELPARTPTPIGPAIVTAYEVPHPEARRGRRGPVARPILAPSRQAQSGCRAVEGTVAIRELARPVPPVYVLSITFPP